MHRWLATPVLAAALLAACACGGGRDDVTVFAASSLGEAFADMGKAFADGGGGRVVLSTGSSAALALQIAEGAPADVFASADTVQPLALAEAGHLAGAHIFAANRLAVAASPGAKQVQSFGDLAQPGVRLVLAGANVPAGRYARGAIDRAAADLGVSFRTAVLANVVSEEPNVRAALAKVELGEADAAIIYMTDLAGSKVRTVEIPPAYNVRAEYALGPVAGARNAAGARAFVAFVLSPAGQAVLARHGFEAAP